MTVTIENTYTGDGSTTDRQFTFPYLDTTDIKVSLDGVVTTAYTLHNATTVRFNTAPNNGVAIRIYRETAYENPKATFYPGSAIRAGDLNDNTLQNLYVNQESNDKVADAWLSGDPTIISTETWYTTDDTKIATTKAIESRIDSKIDTALTTDVVGGTAITVTDDSPSTGKITLAVTAGGIGSTQLAADAVTGAKIADDAIDSEHYAAGSIDNEHLANDAVGIDELAANAVVNNSVKSDAAIEFTKLENLDSAKILVGNGSNKATEVSMSGDVAISNTGATTIQTGAVEHAMLANDCIDGDNIQDDVVDSEHLAAGSIDTEHIANANVSLAKIENIADTKIIVGNGSNRPTAVSVSGDVTIANTGAVTIANDAVNANKIADNAVTTDHIQDAELTTLAGMQSGTASILADSTALTATTAELNILDNKTFRASGDGSLTTTSDTEIPSSKVIAAHVSSTILATGGFISINNEVSFPTTANQPANGVIVSISDAAGTVINGSGTSTTGRTTDGTPATVTINNFPSSLYNETLATGVGMLVTSTGSSNIYNYHKILAAEADVKQLSDDINDFNARYRVAGSAPGSNNDAGDLYFDTAANKMKVYNGTTSQWDDVASVGNFYINTISSSSNTGGGSATFNGSAYRFTLSNPPTMAQQLIVSVNGVLQKPDAGTGQPSEGFAINGNDIIFSAAPASGSDYFIVTQGSSVSIGTPSDNTVSTAKIQNLGVTTAKLAAGAVTNAKITDDTIAEVKLDIHNTPATGKYLKYTSNGMEWSDGASEGTDVKSTGESGTAKFLRVDGDGTCSWQVPPDTNTQVGGSTGVDFNDDVKARFGTSNDLEIYHNGSHSRISDAGTGKLQLGGSEVEILNGAFSEPIAKFIPDGAVELYYNNSKKLETTSSGINVTGSINVNGAALSTAPEITATASGAVTAGKTMIINSNGTTSHVSATTSIRSEPLFTTTTDAAATSGNGHRWALAYDKDNNVLLMTWKNSSNNIYAKAGTPGTDTITWGSEVSVNSDSNSNGPDCCYVGNGKFIVVYRDASSPQRGRCRMVSVSSNTVSVVGLEYNLGNSTSGVGPYLACTYHTQQTRLYVISKDANSGRLRFTSCLVDNTDDDDWCSDWRSKTSGGSGQDGDGTYLRSDNDYTRLDLNDNNSEVGNTNCIYDPDSQRVHVIYCNDSENRMEVVSCDALTSTGVNTAQTIFSNNPQNYTISSCAYDTVTNRSVGMYKYNDDIQARTFTWNSSNTNFDFGTEVTVTAASDGGKFQVMGTDSGAVGFIWRGSGDDLKATIGTLNTSNGDISLSSVGALPGTGTDNNGSPIGVTYNPNQNLIYTVTKYSDAGNKFVESVSITQVNTDAEGYVGIANNSASDGGAVTIRTFGSTNDNQSGLTVGSLYYIKKDGTLSTTADTPSVQAGVALSATKLLIKG